MAAHKGCAKTGGRAKGTPNHVTVSLREAIMNAFTTVGGEAYLVTVAETNPAVFCALLARILPLQLTAARDGDSSPSAKIAETLELLRSRLGPPQIEYSRGIEIERERSEPSAPN